jgi:intein-encoded DNA endonuclease-like protein
MRGLEKRTYTMKDYEKVLNLREEGHTFQEVSDMADVGRATCVKWCNTDRKPRSNYAERKQKCPIKSFRNLDTNLAYLYGLLIGDGYLERSNRNYRVGLNVTDQDFADEFARVLEEWTGLEPKKSQRNVQHDHITKYGCKIECETKSYQVRLSSKKVLDFLESKGKFKTENWSIPEEVIRADENIKSALVKGIFDSEGYSTFSGRARRLELEMKNKSGLRELKQILGDLNIKASLEQSTKQEKKDTYLLRIYDRESIENFNNKSGFSIGRKNGALEDLLDSYKT